MPTNEPAGNGDIWHYHVHAFPRFPDGGLYRLHAEWAGADADEMHDCANRLRAAWPRDEMR